MTNSRLTDPEVLELRFPVRLESFAIRRGSGGAGRWRGGDGARAARALPRADDGGDPVRPPPRAARSAWRAASPARRAQLGRARRRRAVELLGHIDQTEMAPGDVFVIETPGGGGYGAVK